QLEAHVAKYTPAVAEKESGVPARDIERIAIEFAKAAPACTTMSNRGSAKHYNGMQNDRAIRMLDVLVGNVGGNRRGAAHEVPAEEWTALWRLNVESHLRAARVAVPHMIERGRGAIVFVASIFGREAGGPGLAAYNATKSALISLAKIMALELAPRGIRVNSIAPGSIRFPGGSWDKRCRDDPEAMRAFIEQNLPLGRFGHAHEIGDAVAFLASERASLITGTCLNVDGGQSKSLI
ncbi:MAG: SDR family oxidoreductase, partial [Acidobacteriota bacterium]